jgi:hypothetical protein
MTVSLLISVLVGIGVVVGQTARAAALVVVSYLALRGSKPAERNAILTAMEPMFAPGSDSRDATGRRVSDQCRHQHDEPEADH